MKKNRKKNRNKKQPEGSPVQETAEKDAKIIEEEPEEKAGLAEAAMASNVEMNEETERGASKEAAPGKNKTEYKRATKKNIKSREIKKNYGRRKQKPLTGKQKVAEIIRSLIFCTALGAFVFAGTGLLVIFYGYYSSQSEYVDLNDKVVIESTAATKGTEATKAPETETDAEGNVVAIETQPQLENLHIPIKVDDEYYKAVNSEYVLYIYIPGTSIQYPVVHGREGGYYLRYTFRGTENTAGSIYLDYRTDKDAYLKGFNTVMVGHNRKDGTMFSDLTQYAEKGFRDEHPYVYLVMNGREYVYEVFAFYLNDVTGKIYTPGCSYEDLMENVKEKNTLNCDVDVTASDRVLTMYTCNDDSSARYVVHAKLIREY